MQTETGYGLVTVTKQQQRVCTLVVTNCICIHTIYIYESGIWQQNKQITSSILCVWLSKKTTPVIRIDNLNPDAKGSIWYCENNQTTTESMLCTFSFTLWYFTTSDYCSTSWRNFCHQGSPLGFGQLIRRQESLFGLGWFFVTKGPHLDYEDFHHQGSPFGLGRFFVTKGPLLG